MFYTAWIDTPNPQQETIQLSDPRSPGELGTALATDGFLVSNRGETSSAYYNDGQTTVGGFQFKSKGQVVLLARHVIRLDEIVIPPGTSVTET